MQLVPANGSIPELSILLPVSEPLERFSATEVMLKVCVKLDSPSGCVLQRLEWTGPQEELFPTQADETRKKPLFVLALKCWDC